MSKREDDAASRPDEDNPEWTREEIRKARPALEVIAEVFGPNVAEEFRRGRGRPAKDGKKVHQTLRLDPDVVEAYRAQGRGWQAPMNDVLRQHMPRQGK